MTRDRDPVPGDTGPEDTGPRQEPAGWAGPRLRDVSEQWPVVGDPGYLRGVLVTLRTDQVQMPGGDLAQRDVIEDRKSVV